VSDQKKMRPFIGEYRTSDFRLLMSDLCSLQLFS
jgi:hypothetical protein